MNEYPNQDPYDPNDKPYTEQQDYTRRQQQLRLEEEERRLEEEERRMAMAQRTHTLEKIINGVYFLVIALEVLLGIRWVLLLSGANPENQFARFIYTLSAPFVAPFSNLFTSPSFGAGRSVFDINLIVAIAVYALLAILVVRLIRTIGE